MLTRRFLLNGLPLSTAEADSDRSVACCVVVLHLIRYALSDSVGHCKQYPVHSQQDIVLRNDEANNIMVTSRADRLKELRGTESMASIAKRAGIHPNTYATYEKGTDPPWGAVVAIAKVYGLTPDELAGIEKPDAADERRARYERNSEDLSEQGERPPAQTSAEFLGGYFEIADNKITIDIIVRGPEDRVRPGGWRSKQRDNDDS